MEGVERYLAIAALCLVALLFLLIFTVFASAHDHERPELDEWYASMMMPDSVSPCCGKKDAWWCDDVFSRPNKDGSVSNYCRITDDRHVAGRPDIPVGTEVLIPDNKMKFGPNDPQRKIASNPTGHSIVFGAPISPLGGPITLTVYCFVLNSGI